MGLVHPTNGPSSELIFLNVKKHYKNIKSSKNVQEHRKTTLDFNSKDKTDQIWNMDTSFNLKTKPEKKENTLKSKWKSFRTKHRHPSDEPIASRTRLKLKTKRQKGQFIRNMIFRYREDEEPIAKRTRLQLWYRKKLKI